MAEAVAAVLPGLAGIAHPSDVLDMPVDPNEPTYCLCHQVSYGEMIGCDNPDVSFAQSFVYIVLMTVISIFIVSDRVVPFCLRSTHHQTERQMVLPKMYPGPKEEIVLF